MLDKIIIDHVTLKMYLTMPWPKGPTASIRYKAALHFAQELASTEWSKLCHARDPRISFTDNVVPGEVVSIDDGCIVMMRMEGSSQGYKEIGGINIPGFQRRALKAAQANQ